MAALLAVSAPACGKTTIKVYRLHGADGAGTLQPNSEYGRRVLAMTHALTSALQTERKLLATIHETPRAVEDHLQWLVERKEDAAQPAHEPESENRGDELQDEIDYFRDYLDTLNSEQGLYAALAAFEARIRPERIAVINKLAELKRYFDSDPSTGRDLDPGRFELAKIALDLIETQSLLSDYAYGIQRTYFDEIEPVLGFEDALYMQEFLNQQNLATFGDALAPIEEGLRSAQAASSGFGGIAPLGVVELDLSDPGLQEALRVRTSPSKPSKPITSASVSAAGESLVMIVQEHPGQVRVYQVTNDTEQVLQNVALIVSQATATAAKYLTGVPIP